jgi:hypothetical protein
MFLFEKDIYFNHLSFFTFKLRLDQKFGMIDALYTLYSVENGGFRENMSCLAKLIRADALPFFNE